MIPFLVLLALLAPSSQAVTLIHSNDVLGEIEPCGCRTNPLGGYARKANILKKLPDTELIQLDAGDVLFQSDSTPELLKKQTLVQASWIVRILDLMKQDAVTPGEKDFSMGVAAFQKLTRESRTHFLAANLLKRNGHRLLKDSILLTRMRSDGTPFRVAVLGLVGSDLNWPKELQVRDPITTARELIPALRKRADLVIALTHEGLEADQRLAEKVQGIDIIIGGHSQSFLQHPIKIGKTVLYQSSFRNQYVGSLNLEMLQKEEGYRFIGLDANYDSPPGNSTPVDEAIQSFKEAIARLNLKDQTSVQRDVTKVNYQTFPRCSECHLTQFDFWRKTPHANALAPLIKANQDKNKECVQCHSVGLGAMNGFTDLNSVAELQTDSGQRKTLNTSELAVYLSSLHEGRSLKATAQGLGVQIDGKPLTLDSSLGRLQKSWLPVQCENCHGPGGDHPMSEKYPRAVETTVCLKCHTPDRAPEWYRKDGQPDSEKIAEKHRKISCPSGDSVIDP